jgi:hypothetical protein
MGQAANNDRLSHEPGGYTVPIWTGGAVISTVIS